MTQIDPQTETACANIALSSCKAGKILSLDADNTDKAKIIRKHFAPVRDSLQRLYRWNFNEAYLLLPAGGAAPAFRFERRFPFKPDMIGVREVQNCHRRHWKVQGRSILANMPAPIKVVASIRVTDVSVWDALFKSTFCAALAFAIAPEVATDDDTIDRASKASESALARAMPVDANEGTPDEPMEQDIILSRF